MPRVLFLCEAVTLAHVARPLHLSEALLGSHEVTLALAPHAHRFVPVDRFQLEPLDTIPGERFLDALRRGAPVYDEAALSQYVEADLALIDKLRPDLVVGDFRLSLSVSARLRGVPYLSITNAYWSPWFNSPPPLPVLPWTRHVPLVLAQGVFAAARNIAMAAHASPMNRLRTRFGLPPLGVDLRRVYTDADHVAYADMQELFPTPGTPATHRHIGPILWCPPDPLPDWWDTPTKGPSAYVTVGSSGDPDLLPGIVAALDALGITALVATAGASFVAPPGSLARCARYLPGTEAARRVDLVVCNGGSLTSQQALCAGKPVLGIASNMDQFLNMRAVQQAGAGRLVRSDRASTHNISQAARALLGGPACEEAARRLSAVFARYSARDTFREMVAGILGTSHAAGEPTDEKDPAQPDSGIRSIAHAGLRAGLDNEPPDA